jgi:DNA-binding NarL/FixJ family response regulator
MALKILVADDHEIVRHGLCALLRGQPDWEICGEASDGREAVEKALALSPDVTVLDIGMPNLNGLEATRQILKANPHARILILTLHDSDQLVQEVLDAGARGFLLKSDAARDLVAAVEAVRRDKIYFTPKVSSMVLNGYLRRTDTKAHAETPRRGKEFKGSCGGTRAQRKNCRNSPLKHHAQARSAFGKRSGAIRRAQ